MSVKEMFEDLGYEFNDYSDEKNKSDDLYAIYVYEIRQFLKYSPQVLYKEVAFFPNLKKVEIYVNDDFNEVENCLWSIEELQVINKQIEELGWNKC